MSKFFKKIVIVSLLGYRAVDPTIFMSYMFTEYSDLIQQEVQTDTYYVQKREETIIIKKTNHLKSEKIGVEKKESTIKKIEAEIATLTKKSRSKGTDSSLTNLGQQMKYLSGSLLCGTYREQ